MPILAALFHLLLWPALLSAGQPDSPASGIVVGDMEARKEPWKLVWSDEFDGPAGAPPDPAKWRVLEGGDGWGNAELQHYLDRRENVRLDGKGTLVIEARRERFGERDFTSARITTAGKAAWKYGRFEARMRVPKGQGFWPAFWMMGESAETVGWPDCGEIDIMEYVGKGPLEVHGAIHGPGYSGADGLASTLRSRDGRGFAEDFHIYAVEWGPEKIRWFVDGEEFVSRTRADLRGNEWVFNTPFAIILNLAVGGHWPGAPDETTVFPGKLLVDWVRVHQEAEQKPGK